MNTTMHPSVSVSDPAPAIPRDRETAFALAYHEHHRRALRFAGLLYGDANRAGYAVADAFARIWRRHRTTGDVDTMWPYLRTALVNGFIKPLSKPL